MATGDVLGLSLWAFVGVLQLLFGATWIAAAWLSDTLRRALLAMAWFNLMLGTSLLLVGWRDEGPYFLTHTVSKLMQVVGCVLLWQAGCGLTGAAPRHAEQRLLVLLAGGAVLVLGMSPVTEQGRVAVSLLANAWVALRAGTQVAQQLLRSGAPRVALAVLLSAASAGTALVARAVGGLFIGAEVDIRFHGSLALAWAQLAPIFVINMAAAHQAFGRLVREVNRLQRRDALTGLADGVTLDGVLAQEWRRRRQWGSPVVVMELAVDQLGAVRQHFGVHTADAVLAELSWKLKLGLRAGDVLAHCGDGVFRVLLPGTRRAAALALAQDLLAKVASDGGLHPESGQRLTLSIGLAEADAGDGGPQAVLRRAQAQAQCARLAGGDRVVADAVTLQPTAPSGRRAAAA